jgi:hypothetical protein
MNTEQPQPRSAGTIPVNGRPGGVRRLKRRIKPLAGLGLQTTVLGGLPMRRLLICLSVLLASAGFAEPAAGSGGRLLLREGQTGPYFAPGAFVILRMEFAIGGLHCTQVEDAEVTSNLSAKDKVVATRTALDEFGEEERHCQSLVAISGRLASLQVTSKGRFTAAGGTLVLTMTNFVFGQPSYNCVYPIKKFAGGFPLPSKLNALTATTQAKLDRSTSNSACLAKEPVEAHFYLNFLRPVGSFGEFEESPVWAET